MNSRKVNAKTLVFVAMMGAVAAVLMMIDFSVPLVPGFLKFDIAELPALFVGFFIGPVSGSAVIAVKLLLKLVMKGTDTAFVGELTNLLGNMCFVVPASLIYKMRHTKQGAIISLAVSTFIVSIAFVLLNYFIGFPLYGKFYGLSIEAIVDMGKAVNPLIKDEATLLLFSIFPFNIFKYGIISIITYGIYKKAGAVLRNIMSPDSVSH